MEFQISSIEKVAHDDSYGSVRASLVKKPLPALIWRRGVARAPRRARGLKHALVILVIVAVASRAPHGARVD